MDRRLRGSKMGIRGYFCFALRGKTPHSLLFIIFYLFFRRLGVVRHPLAGGHNRGIGPEVLEVVVVVSLLGKDVDDDAAVVQQHPALAVVALGAQHLDALAVQLELGLIGQWADVHVTGSRAALLVGELAE